MGFVNSKKISQCLSFPQQFELYLCWSCDGTLLCFRPRRVLQRNTHVQQQRWMSQHHGLISLCMQGGILWRWILLLRSHSKPHFLFFKRCALCVYGLCVWSPLQTVMSVQRTATCVRAATVWTSPEDIAVNVTWASYPLLTRSPARVRQIDTARLSEFQTSLTS